MNIVNCYPHDLVIAGKVKLPASEVVLRLEESMVQIGEIEGARFFERWTTVHGLPPRQPETLYVVRAVVAEARRDRDDLIVPNVVRDDRGRIVRCDSFYRLR